MSRPIKFRGKRIDNGEFAQGWYVRVKALEQYRHYIYDDNNIAHEVDPETVGQYTGLRDSKKTEEYPEGQEIYEKDILDDGEGLGEVEWVQEHCAFMVYTKYQSSKYPNSYYLFESDGQLKRTVVIGNICDHPHLLEGNAG